MPRFFLHLRDGGQLLEDPEGSELPGLDAARADALAAAREIAAERLKAGAPPIAGEFEIRDGAGRLLATVPFPQVSDPP
jgi:uncharacterized protein DUF6894